MGMRKGVRTYEALKSDVGDNADSHINRSDSKVAGSGDDNGSLRLSPN